MVFTGLKLLTISSNTGLSSESEEWRSVYPLEVGIGATWFGIRRTFLAMGDGGTEESSVEFEIEGEWTCIAETCPEEKFSDTLFATGLLVRAWSIILGIFC